MNSVGVSDGRARSRIPRLSPAARARPARPHPQVRAARRAACRASSMPVSSFCRLGLRLRLDRDHSRRLNGRRMRSGGGRQPTTTPQPPERRGDASQNRHDRQPDEPWGQSCRTALHEWAPRLRHLHLGRRRRYQSRVAGAPETWIPARAGEVGGAADPGGHDHKHDQQYGEIEGAASSRSCPDAQRVPQVVSHVSELIEGGFSLARLLPINAWGAERVRAEQHTKSTDGANLATHMESRTSKPGSS